MYNGRKSMTYLIKFTPKALKSVSIQTKSTKGYFQFDAIIAVLVSCFRFI